MAATVTDIVKIMEAIAPSHLAQKWDNVGLQVGDPNRAVASVWVALDPTLKVIRDAAQNGTDLLITHHPLFFRPLKCIDLRSEQGAVIEMALAHGIAIFAAHTNLDAAIGGANDILARRLGLVDAVPLAVGAAQGNCHETPRQDVPGLGRIGRLASSMALGEFAQMVRDRLELETVKVSGDPRLQVEWAAVCSGSGSGLMKDFFASSAQVYVSGDLHYHDAMDAVAAGRGFVDVGHFASEHIMVDALVERLRERITGARIQAEVKACGIEKDPFRQV